MAGDGWFEQVSRTAEVQCTPDLQPTDVTGLSVFELVRRRRAVA